MKHDDDQQTKEPLARKTSYIQIARFRELNLGLNVVLKNISNKIRQYRVSNISPVIIINTSIWKYLL